MRLMTLGLSMVPFLLYLRFTIAGDGLSDLEDSNACTPAYTDLLLFELHLDEFLVIRETGKPTCFDWTSDGCSKVPHNPFGFHFAPSCWRHDFAYRNLKIQLRFNHNNRERVDIHFKNDLNQVCSNYGKRKWLCRFAAFIYFTGVRIFGSPRIAWWASVCIWAIIIVAAAIAIYSQALRKKKRSREEEKNPDFDEFQFGLPVRRVRMLDGNWDPVSDEKR
jgi:hypothetical protein